MKYFNIFLLLIITLLFSCKKKVEEESNLLTSEKLYNIMDEVYLWNYTITDHPDLNKNPFELLEDLRYKPIDKWSYISSTEEYFAYFEQGKYFGYGFGFSPDNDNNLRVSFVFDDSPMKEEGVERGWIIRKINGITIDTQTDLYEILSGTISNTFTFEDHDSVSHQFSFTMKEISINSVLYDDILERNNKKIGYLVFQTFIEVSREELLASFKKFKEAQIDELIIDLRYNGGGRLDIGLLLGGLIGGDKVAEQVMVAFQHNENLADENESEFFEINDNSVDIDRAFFITTKGTASASEMLINGLAPFIAVLQIGDDTHGKPVGMYGFPFKDYTVVPISFQITNAEGYGEYYDGLESDAYVDDDITHNFGDTLESCLNEALYYIEHDEFSLGTQIS